MEIAVYTAILLLDFTHGSCMWSLCTFCGVRAVCCSLPCGLATQMLMDCQPSATIMERQPALSVASRNQRPPLLQLQDYN